MVLVQGRWTGLSSRCWRIGSTKAARLAGPGLGRANEVLAAQANWDRGKLNGSRDGVSCLANRPFKPLVQVEFGERSGSLFRCDILGLARHKLLLAGLRLTFDLGLEALFAKNGSVSGRFERQLCVLAASRAWGNVCLAVASPVVSTPCGALLVALFAAGRWFEATSLKLFLGFRAERELGLTVAADEYFVLIVQKLHSWLVK